jgi:GTP cyclohydrolase I
MTTASTVRVSELIRQRLLTRHRPFHANDNIADCIEAGELDALVDEVAEHMQEVLRTLVIDVEKDPHTRETARRVAKMYVREVFAGRYQAPPALTAFPNQKESQDLMVIGPLSVRSSCSHHLCPVIGRVWIGVLPSAHSPVIGLSKYARLTQWIMSRPQVQEDAVVQLANAIEKAIAPQGLAVLLEAQHFCMHWRGVKDENGHMRSTVWRGILAHDASERQSFLAAIPPMAA